VIDTHFPRIVFEIKSRDQQIIARAMTTLRDAKRLKVQRGVYTIPFQFVLPASLPSSTQFPRVDGRSYNGKIEVCKW
jgi:hypothetical protein